MPHLLWRAFEESSTTERKKRVTHKPDSRFGAVKHNMPTSMARRVVDLKDPIAQHDCVTLADCSIDTRNPINVCGGPDDFTLGLSFKFQIATRMIVMMVCVENKIQGPVFFL